MWVVRRFIEPWKEKKSVETDIQGEDFFRFFGAYRLSKQIKQQEFETHRDMIPDLDKLFMEPGITKEKPEVEHEIETESRFWLREWLWKERGVSQIFAADGLGHMILPFACQQRHTWKREGVYEENFGGPKYAWSGDVPWNKWPVA